MQSVRLKPPTVFAWHLGAIACLAAGHLLGVLLLADRAPFTFDSVRAFFDLGAEAGPGAFVSSLALLASAFAAVLAANAEPDVRQRRFWFIVAALLAFLAFDEAAAVHEKFGGIGDRVTDGRGIFTISWWAIYPFALAPAVALATPGLLRLDPATRGRLVVAGLVFVAGAIGMEIAESAARDAFVTANNLRGPGGIDWKAYAAALEVAGAGYLRTHDQYVLVEETLEMLGVALALRAILRRGAAVGAGLRVTIVPVA